MLTRCPGAVGWRRVSAARHDASTNRRTCKEKEDMMELSEKRWSPRAVNYVGCYALYALLVVLGVTVLFIWPTTVVALIGAFIGLSEANELIYMLSNLLLGLSLFTLVIAGEPYLRSGIRRRQLRRRFVRLAVPLGILSVFGLVLQTWAISLLR